MEEGKKQQDMSLNGYEEYAGIKVSFNAKVGSVKIETENNNVLLPQEGAEQIANMLKKAARLAGMEDMKR